MEQKLLYADGLDRMTLLEGLVRMDFYCAGEQGEDGEVTHEPVGRLLLPPPAYLRMYEAMGELIARMEEAGLVQRNARVAAPAHEEVKKAPSPNFS